jgi:hypothetical protein
MRRWFGSSPQNLGLRCLVFYLFSFLFLCFLIILMEDVNLFESKCILHVFETCQNDSLTLIEQWNAIGLF